MVAVVVTRRFSMTDEERRALANMEPRAMEAFMVKQGRNMVQQARKNIRTFGTKASNVWPKLSTAYAKAKRKGWTPGRGANKYAMLRDTGFMYASLVGLVSSDGRGRVSVALDATGTPCVGATASAAWSRVARLPPPVSACRWSVGAVFRRGDAWWPSL